MKHGLAQSSTLNRSWESAMAEPPPRPHPHNLKIHWTLPIVKHPSRRGGKRGGRREKTSRKEKKKIIQPFPSLFCFDLPRCHTGGTCSSQVSTELFSKDEKLLFFPARVCLGSHSPPAREAVFLGLGPGLPGQMGAVLFFLEKKKTSD